MDHEYDLLGVLCTSHLKGDINAQQFEECVYALTAPWGAICMATMLFQVESTIKRHVCWWWNDCVKECCYLTDKERVLPWMDGWCTLHGDNVVIRKTHRQIDKQPRMRPLNARHKVTSKVRLHVFARDNHQCRQCQAKDVTLEVDHIIPVSKGGSSEEHNLQTLCKPCNRIKRDSVAEA